MYMIEKFCITNDTDRKTALMILFEGMIMIRKCACVFFHSGLCLIIKEHMNIFVYENIKIW